MKIIDNSRSNGVYSFQNPSSSNPLVFSSPRKISSVANKMILLEPSAAAIPQMQGSEDAISNVAMWFLCKSAMSNKKLQKLCYYAYSWYIVFFNELEDALSSGCVLNVLSSEKFEAWIHGPVNPRLYRRYRDYGWEDIPRQRVRVRITSPNFEDMLEQVWESYGDFSADDLEWLTHNELPWINARRGVAPNVPCNNKIDDLDILKYYATLR